MNHLSGVTGTIMECHNPTCNRVLSVDAEEARIRAANDYDESRDYE